MRKPSKICSRAEDNYNIFQIFPMFISLFEISTHSERYYSCGKEVMITVQLHFYLLFIFFSTPEEKQHRRNKILDSLSDISGQPAVSYSSKIFLKLTPMHTQMHTNTCGCMYTYL